MFRSALNSIRHIRSKTLKSSNKLASIRFQTTDSQSASRDEHLESLRKYYPPSLIKSILAAEAAITPEQWANKQIETDNQFAPLYNEDFSKYDPLFDFPKHEWVNKTEPWQPIPQRLPPGVDVITDTNKDVVRNLDTAEMERLTGISKEFLKTLMAKTLIVKKVANMTRKGKQYSFYCLAVVGDKDGHVGIGEGRDASTTAGASARAVWDGIKHLKFVPRYDGRTIFGTVTNKYGSVLLELSAAPPGSGLKVNHVVYEICKACGIRDLGGHIRRSRNPMNVAKATIEALTEKQVSIENIAAGRGKKIVDITGTYYNF